MSWCFVCFYIPQKTLSTTSSISSSSRVPTSTPIDPQPSPKETKTLNLSHPEPSLKFPKKNWAKQSFTKADTTPNLQEYPSPRPPQNPSQPFFIFKYQPVIRIKKVKHFVPQQKPVWRNLSSQPGLRRDICCAGQIPQWVVNKVHDGKHDHDDEDDHDDSDDITTPTVVLDNHHHHQLSLTITITTSCPWHGGGNPLLLRRGTISWSGASRTPWKKGHLNDCDNDDAGDPDDDVVWGHFSKWPWWWLWWWKLWWPRFTQLSRRYGATAKSQWNTWVGWREVNLQYSSCMCLNNL